MDKTSSATSADWLKKTELVTQEAVAKFSAVLPSIAPAIKIHGESGLRIQLDIADSDMAEALKLVLWRKCVFEVTVKPVPK